MERMDAAIHSSAMLMVERAMNGANIVVTVVRMAIDFRYFINSYTHTRTVVIILSDFVNHDHDILPFCVFYFVSTGSKDDVPLGFLSHLH
jgi:hypothetical protein